MLYDGPIDVGMLIRPRAIMLTSWMVRNLSTSAAEMGSAYVVLHANLGSRAIGFSMAGFLMTAVAQQAMKHHPPRIYWLIVVMSGIIGTQIPDALGNRLEISACVSAAAFLIHRLGHNHRLIRDSQTISSRAAERRPESVLTRGVEK